MVNRNPIINEIMFSDEMSIGLKIYSEDCSYSTGIIMAWSKKIFGK